MKKTTVSYDRSYDWPDSAGNYQMQYTFNLAQEPMTQKPPRNVFVVQGWREVFGGPKQITMNSQEALFSLGKKISKNE